MARAVHLVGIDRGQSDACVADAESVAIMDVDHGAGDEGGGDNEHAKLLHWRDFGARPRGRRERPKKTPPVRGTYPSVYPPVAQSRRAASGQRDGLLGAWLPGLFPPQVRYTGTSLAFNVGGILGGGLTPAIAQMLAQRGGLASVGLYLAAAVLSLGG